MSIICSFLNFIHKNLNKKNNNLSINYTLDDYLTDLDELRDINLNKDTVNLFFNSKYFFITQEPGKVKFNKMFLYRDTGVGIFAILELFIYPLSTIYNFDNSHVYYWPEITIAIMEIFGLFLAYSKNYFVIDYTNKLIYKEFNYSFFRQKNFVLKFSEIDKISINYYTNTSNQQKIKLSEIDKIFTNKAYFQNHVEVNEDNFLQSEIVILSTYGEILTFSIDPNDNCWPTNQAFVSRIALALKKRFIKNQNRNSIKIIYKSNNYDIAFTSNFEKLEKESEVDTTSGTILIIIGVIIIISILFYIGKSQLNY